MTAQHISSDIYVSLHRIPSHFPHGYGIFWDKGIVNGGNHLALYGDKTSNVIIVAWALSTSHPISINCGTATAIVHF